MKNKLSIIGALIVIGAITAFAGYVTVVNGSGSPSGVIVAEPGQLYTDTATGDIYTKASGNGTSTGWSAFKVSALGNAVTGTITVTSGAATLTNSAITTNSYAVLTAQGTNAPSSPYTFTPSAGTAAISGGTNTTTARYILFNP